MRTFLWIVLCCCCECFWIFTRWFETRELAYMCKRVDGKESAKEWSWWLPGGWMRKTKESPQAEAIKHCFNCRYWWYKEQMMHGKAQEVDMPISNPLSEMSYAYRRWLTLSTQSHPSLSEEIRFEEYETSGANHQNHGTNLANTKNSCQSIPRRLAIPVSASKSRLLRSSAWTLLRWTTVKSSSVKREPEVTTVYCCSRYELNNDSAHDWNIVRNISKRQSGELHVWCTWYQLGVWSSWHLSHGFHSSNIDWRFQCSTKRWGLTLNMH